MKVKHIYDLKPLKPGSEPRYHVVTDGLVVSSHRSDVAGLKAMGKKPNHGLYCQYPPSTLQGGFRQSGYLVRIS